MMVRFWACVVAVVGLLPGSAGRLGGLPKALPVPMVPAGTRCTHEGRPVACFNLTRGDREACAREVSPRGRWAVVSVFDCHASFDGVNARGGQDTAGLLSNVKRARENGAEFVLALPRAEAQAVPFPAEVRAALEAAGATVETVGWVVPPNLSKHVLVESGGCCGAREFMKLHAFGMTRYDAVLLVDTDVRIARNASLAPLLGCAADGYFLSTRGTHSACDRPRPRLFGGGCATARARRAAPPGSTAATSRSLRARSSCAARSPSSARRPSARPRAGTTPDGAPFTPSTTPACKASYTGSSTSGAARRRERFAPEGRERFALARRGAPDLAVAEGLPRPVQIDPCVWNVLRGLDDTLCGADCAGPPRTVHHGSLAEGHHSCGPAPNISL